MSAPTAPPPPDLPADGTAAADPSRAEGVRLLHRVEGGRSWPMLVWSFDEPVRMIASAPVGGGVGDRRWILNAQVPSGYERRDLAAHVDELGAIAGEPLGGGVGMLTAADVSGAVPATDGGAAVIASVGIRVPTWAAAPRGADDPRISPDEAMRLATIGPGTINVVVVVPVPMSDAALVNLVATATEAKTQALFDASIDGTGTATDAVCVACPRPAAGDPGEPFGGPRSTWGARVARATHRSVRAGIDASLGIIAADRQHP